MASLSDEAVESFDEAAAGAWADTDSLDEAVAGAFAGAESFAAAVAAGALADAESLAAAAAVGALADGSGFGDGVSARCGAGSGASDRVIRSLPSADPRDNADSMPDMRSANGCAGSPTNDGAASAHAATKPDASALVRHGRAFGATRNAMGVGGAAASSRARGRRTTAVGAVGGTRRSGRCTALEEGRNGAIRVSGVIGVDASATVASRESDHPVTSESDRSRSRVRAPVISISPWCGRASGNGRS